MSYVDSNVFCEKYFIIFLSEKNMVEILLNRYAVCEKLQMYPTVLYIDI